MHDILPEQTPAWQRLEKTFRDLIAAYCYKEIRLPLVERTELFRRSIGEETDIVEKEMYTFEDRNGESLSLRPEATASCVRAGVEHGLFHNQVQKLWYMGPMFRHERPQKGRYRQFHQIGVETFGLAGPDIDAELLLIAARLWRELGLENEVSLEINSLGSAAARATYRGLLVEYLHRHESLLDEDSCRRMKSNPLRVLDSKHPAVQSVMEGAPKLWDVLDSESCKHFDQLTTLLDMAGVSYRVNPRLVRGLDYYSRTVFEWVTDRLGAQGAVCAGGRYDGLVEQLGGRPTTAAGFAIGIERLLEMLNQVFGPREHKAVDVYLILVGALAQPKGLVLAEHLRNSLPRLRLLTHCGAGGLKSQLRKADRSDARFALIIGDTEVAQRQIVVKPLREDVEQVHVPEQEIVDHLRARL